MGAFEIDVAEISNLESAVMVSLEYHLNYKSYEKVHHAKTHRNSCGGRILRPGWTRDDLKLRSR